MKQLNKQNLAPMPRWTQLVCVIEDNTTSVLMRKHNWTPNHIYDILGHLRKQGIITSKPDGRANINTLTPKGVLLKEHFQLIQSILKEL